MKKIIVSIVILFFFGIFLILNSINSTFASYFSVNLAGAIISIMSSLVLIALILKYGNTE